MKKTSFEDYLKEVHGEDYNGTDDGMPDAFDAWVTELQADDWMKLGDGFRDFVINEFKVNTPKEVFTFTNDALLHMFAGLVSAGMNEDGEEEWIGNDKQWNLYNRISEEYGN